MKKNREKNICKGETIIFQNGQQVIDCEKCGFIHIYPYPDFEKLSLMYREKFYEDEKPEYITKFEKEKEYWFAIYKERFELVEDFLKIKKRRVLDIGSSIGFFLKAGQELGWDVVGVEPSKTASNYANSIGVETINDIFENIDLKKIGKFSFIHMSLVLEHITFPHNLLNLSYGLLEKGGVICIEVPNDFNPFQKILVDNFGKSNYWVTFGENPHHLNYFNKESLQNLLKKNKFKVLYDTVTFPMELFVLMGDDYIGSDNIGKKCHEKRMTFEKNLLNSNKKIKSDLYKKLSQLNLGREIVVFGKK